MSLVTAKAAPGGADPAALLRGMFDAAVAAALPAGIVAAALPERPGGRTIVLGAGKASAAMAAAVEAAWEGPLEGLVVTRYGHAVPCDRIEIVEAAHPVPDEAGRAAAARMLEIARGAGPDDLVLCLISGGGSALMALPAEGIPFADKQAVNAALLRSGADIAEMNTVRRHLSAVKGGRLAAAAHPARVVSLVISDVPGDDPAAIASGPTVPDPSTFAEAKAILARYGIDAPASVKARLTAAADETPKPGDPRLAGAELRMIATPQMSLEAAAAVARAAGVTPLILGDALEGEAAEVGTLMAGIARSAAAHGHPAPAPCVLLSGGETTVTVRGPGRGGRNVEFLLGLAVALNGAPGVWALAGDTDGIDGGGPAAGALVTPDTLARARALGLDPRAMLAANDAHPLFEALGDAVVTGPTLTNVNDFRAILVTEGA
ncbi:glycerate kinase [Amaricoccus sp.]|uniref:glycerate kinase type-2 family protein n=1 Tax=Amaricoccus sp. TaxID=1872485 RepID=UPI001B5207FF|nr:glycerate kinase [Amaricoccus sp.]MBP7001985.1 glycerate kinase [Amaricoccus sp.]